MRRYCSILYKKLQHDLVQCMNTTACFQVQVETCFQIAYRYWNKVKEQLDAHTFAMDENEIHFFKRLKPKFTSEIEYYELLYHAAVFEPSGLDDAVHFWNRESRRLQNFKKENKSFLQCYFDNKCDLLPYYFLRKYNLESVQRIKLYDAGTIHCTNGDSLVALFLALKRYIKYVYERQAAMPKYS